MDSTELSSPYLAENIHMSDSHSRSASSEFPEFAEPNTVELSETSYMSDVQSSSENQPFPYVTEQVPEEIAPNQQIESLVEILSRLESKVITSRKNIVNVHRDNVLDGGFRAFGRKSFDMWYELDVKFSGEDGIDAGGPQHECMRLVLKAIKELQIFSGPDNAKVLVLDYKYLRMDFRLWV